MDGYETPIAKYISYYSPPKDYIYLHIKGTYSAKLYALGYKSRYDSRASSSSIVIYTVTPLKRNTVIKECNN